MSAPVHTTDAELHQLLKDNSVVMLDLWAEWCVPCKRMDPILADLAKENAGKLVVAKLNTEENPKTMNQYGVMGLPAILVFKDGRRVESLSGFQSKDQLQKRLASSAGV